MQVISSKDNEIIKSVKKLKEKKYRDLENKFIVEGIKIVEEAINENASISMIIVCEDCVNDGTITKDLAYKIAKYNCIYVTEKVFSMLTDVKSPQGILAVIEKNNKNNQIDYSQEIIIALDDLQDPGNLGTILRTIDSAGLNQIILSKNSADSYNPKVVRSTMGAIFRINIIEVEDLVKTLKEIQASNFEVMVTALDAKESIYDTEYKNKVIVIGNEANGVSQEVQELANKKVKIPMLGKTESLNASVAASIMIYEYVRQKCPTRGRFFVPYKNLTSLTLSLATIRDKMQKEGSSMAKILIVEDEKNISKLIQDIVGLANYESDYSFDGEDALNKIKENNYDLILLDIMLPKLNGFEIVNKLDEINTPIIFLSAKNDVETIVKGLKCGAQDYITKPFEPLELLARIELRLKEKVEKNYNFKNIKVNIETREVLKNDQIVALAPKEYELFILLLKNKNKVLTRNKILDKVWDIDAEIETRTVDYHIQQLRKKLDLKNNIITINKIGYILKEE